MGVQAAHGHGTGSHPAHRHSSSSEDLRASSLYVSTAAATLSTVLVGVVCAGYGLTTYIGVLLNYEVERAWLTALYTLGILTVQVGYFSRPGATITPIRTTLALLTLAALVFGPAVQLGDAWISYSGFLAGSLLIVVPVPWSWLAFGMVVASSAVMHRQFGDVNMGELYTLTYSVMATALTGLIIYGLTRLARLIRELHDVRDELTRMAVAEERLRFARDAHDLLGLSLSTIALKGELADRLVISEPEEAKREIGQLLTVARRALGEVRMVAAGNTMLSLTEELVSAQAVLEAAGIDTVVRGHTIELPDDVAALFATLLREAVTNVLRHSKADVCQVAVTASDTTARISVMNDRAEEPGAPQADGGRGSRQRGTENLRQRFEDREGLVSIDYNDDSYCITGSVPLGRPR